MARARLDEVVEVYDSAAKVLYGLIVAAEAGDADAPKKVAAQLSVLQDLFARVRKAEEAFQEKFGEGIQDDEIDLDAVRDEIGRRLDRIRDCSAATGVSG